MIVNQKLYDKIKKEIDMELKNKNKRWSAYASGRLVQEYKRRGGKYKGKRDGKLKRWYDEEWIDVCYYPKIVPCGRTGKRPFPYCRPLHKFKGTPKTVKELTKKDIQRRCAAKRRNPKRNVMPFKPKVITFKDHPDFRPNLTPRQMFLLGSFGGTYWRPIYSTVTKKHYRNQHLKYPWWKGIPKDHLVLPFDKYDKSINRYNVKVGTTLRFWESKGWITKYHPYGWVQWYCDFYQGKRGPDDIRQIRRWKNLAGPRGRFRRSLINLIRRKKGKYNDYTISPKMRQTLQHWGYTLTLKDFNEK